MAPHPAPALVKDSLLQDPRLLYLHSCKKIFVHRDYTSGLNVRFDIAYPLHLRGMISESTWETTMNRINRIFAEAEEIGWASIMETLLGCATCYFSRLIGKTIYEKKLGELSEYLEQQNRDVYIPANVYILNPMERGLRAIEVCLLGTDPRSASNGDAYRRSDLPH